MEKQLFETIYKEYNSKVYRLCLGYLGSRESAEDLCQEIFVKIFQKYQTFEHKSSVGTWIYRITVNTCLNQLRKQKKENTQSISDKEISEKIDEKINKQIEKIETATNQEENIQLLQICIQKLNEMDRILITMVLEDIPYSQISETLGISEANVRVKVHRIKKELEKLFKIYQNV